MNGEYRARAAASDSRTGRLALPCRATFVRNFFAGPRDDDAECKPEGLGGARPIAATPATVDEPRGVVPGMPIGHRPSADITRIPQGTLDMSIRIDL
jgi:hypothetical protein